MYVKLSSKQIYSQSVLYVTKLALNDIAPAVIERFLLANSIKMVNLYLVDVFVWKRGLNVW